MLADVKCFCYPYSGVIVDVLVCDCVVSEEFSGELCLVVFLYVILDGTDVTCCFV